MPITDGRCADRSGREGGRAITGHRSRPRPTSAHVGLGSPGLTWSPGRKPAGGPAARATAAAPRGGSPALSVQLTPGGSGQGLEVPRIADFTHRPGLEPATGEEPAPNFLLSQWDHGSRPALPAPKVRENPFRYTRRMTA